MIGIETILEEPVVQALGWALIHFIWQGAIVAILLAGITGLLRRRSANLRYLIACGAMALMLALPIATMWTLYAASPETAAQEASLIQAAYAPQPVAIAVESAAANPSDALPVTTSSESWRQMLYGQVGPLMPWFISVWFFGVFLLSIRLLGGWANAQHLRKKGTRAVPPHWQETLTRLREQLRVARPVRMLESAFIQVPTVIGWMRPVILLPASAFTGLTPQQLESILAHELAHIRRHDYLINLMQTVIETLLFYHPAVWWVSHRIRVEREHCCDDVAVAHCGDAIIYARALTELEQLRSGHPQLAVAATGGSLLDRVRRLAGVPSPKSNRFAGLLAGTIAILIVISVGAGAQISLDSDPAKDEDPAALSKTQSSQKERAPDASLIIEQDSFEQSDHSPDQSASEDDSSDTEQDMIKEESEDESAQSDQDGDTDQDQQTSGQESEGLKQEQKKRIVDAFIAALKDEDASVRKQAAASLGSSKDPRVVEPLMAAAKDSSPQVRQQAIASLGDLRDKRATDIVLAALKDENAHVRQQAAAALGDLRDPRSTEALIAALKDENAHVRQQAAAALGDLRDKRAVDGLLVALKDSIPHVRQQAAAALGDLRDPRSVPALIAAVADPNPYVRSQVIAALGDLRDSRAVDALLAAMKDENAYVRKAAAAALADIR